MSRTLADVFATFKKWMHFPDPMPLLATLGAVAANRMPGDPVWLLLVGPPGSGKTETLGATHMLPDVHAAATLTEGGLLSGTPKKEHAQGANGGLLREIGDRGIILCKDFGSVLSMHRDERSRVLAALREIYDGSWTRHVGTDGGKKLSWSGSIGLIAGCPPTIDRHHGVMSSLGERFVLLRFRETSSETHTRMALAHAGREREMRRELATAVAVLFQGLNLDQPVTASETEEKRLIDLAMLVSRCRSSVERDGYSREIELVPGAESPTRLAVCLLRLFSGLGAIGLEREQAWSVVRRVAVDSMPAIRRSALAALERRKEADTAEIATEIGYPSVTARRTLEDLAAYSVVRRFPRGPGNADHWRVADDFAPYLATVPEMSDGAGNLEEICAKLLLLNTKPVFDDKSGTVPEVSSSAWQPNGAGPPAAGAVPDIPDGGEDSDAPDARSTGPIHVAGSGHA